MKLSHSKLNTIMSCPMSYYLNYVQGITLKKTKNAFAIGSAVHWGIEHSTEDLTEYWNQNFATKDNYTTEQLLAESMVHGYLKHKDEIFNQILTDEETTQKEDVLDEIHELTVTAPLKSYRFEKPHDFLGIIDLLLVTEKGFVVIDYKTSSQTPDWNKYLDQIYRYIFLLKHEFPDIPVYKIGIINLRKASLRQKQKENDVDFLNRLKFEYELNESNYINVHVYDPNKLDENLINRYIENLSREADAAETIDDNKLFFINYANADGMYGKSDYWDIFYHTPDAYLLYKIRDYIYDELEEDFTTSRDCNKLDLKTIEESNILNHYYDYKKEVLNNSNLIGFNVDNELQKVYLKTMLKEDEFEKEKESVIEMIKPIFTDLSEEKVKSISEKIFKINTYKKFNEVINKINSIEDENSLLSYFESLGN